jgi:hypothetical protein
MQENVNADAFFTFYEEETSMLVAKAAEKD